MPPGRGFGCRGGLQCDFSLDGFRARLEDLPCERWVEIVQGEQKEHQACGCSAGVGAQRAWWAVSGSKKSPKRQPKGAVPMEIDSISEGPKPGRCAGTALPGPALTGLEAPPGILKNRRKEAEVEIEAPGARNPLSGTPFSFLFRGFVSDVSVLGPSGTPVFRDEAPEVREDSLGDPSLLRKEHDLEVVEHDCAHEFSEVCSDFEFFPERPKAFRKFWHGVSMFELVRKQCSLNFGMLGLFGMIGMTLLLAAVFAFGAFCGKGNDGQLVACGGSELRRSRILELRV